MVEYEVFAFRSANCQSQMAMVLDTPKIHGTASEKARRRTSERQIFNSLPIELAAQFRRRAVYGYRKHVRPDCRTVVEKSLSGKLGFRPDSFTAGREVKRAIAPKALDRFKQRIREITGRAKGVSMETTMEQLAPYMRGWRSYFGFCETPEVLVGLTRWVRLRLRAALWRQLLELGMRLRLASNTAGSGHGPWYLARAQALAFGLSNAYFKSLGLPSLIAGC